MRWSASGDLSREAVHLRSIAKQQRFAAVGAINETLFAAREAVIGAMGVFDRPTPFTLRSPRVVKAEPATLQGELVIPTESGGPAAAESALASLPAGKPLLAEVEGGARRFKRSEKLLHAKGILPRGMYAVPGPAAETDAYGNWTRGQINHLLAYFQAFPTLSKSGRSRLVNTSAESIAKLKRGVGRRAGKFGTEYFVVQAGQKGLRPGVYMRKTAARRTVYGPAQRVRAVLFFVTRTQYRKLYRFHESARRRVLDRFERTFARRFEAAMATARG